MSLEGEHKNAKINRCVVTFVDPGADDNVSYQPNQVVFPEEGSAIDVAMLAEDDGKRLQKEIVLPTVTSREQALQYGEVFTKRSRTSKYVQFGTTLATSNTGVGDLINIANEHIGLSGVFRIVEMKIDAGGDIMIGAVEHQPTNYAIAAKSIAATRPVINLPNPLAAVSPATNLQYTANSVNLSLRFAVVGFKHQLGSLTFTPSADTNIVSYQIAVLRVGDPVSDTRFFTQLASTVATNASGDIIFKFMEFDLRGSKAHKVSVFAINNQGNRSAAATITPDPMFVSLTTSGSTLKTVSSTNVNLNP